MAKISIPWNLEEFLQPQYHTSLHQIRGKKQKNKTSAWNSTNSTDTVDNCALCSIFVLHSLAVLLLFNSPPFLWQRNSPWACRHQRFATSSAPPSSLSRWKCTPPPKDTSATWAAPSKGTRRRTWRGSATTSASTPTLTTTSPIPAACVPCSSWGSVPKTPESTRLSLKMLWGEPSAPLN